MSLARARYCLRCGHRLVSRDDNGSPRPTCPACGYIHYRNPAPAAGVILARDHGLLLVRRKFDPRAGTWCLPAGFLEYGESPERCAVRELREETGIRARLTGLFGVYAGIDDPRARTVLILYLADPTGGRLRPGDDAIEARFFPLGRLPGDLSFASHERAIAEYLEHRARD
ncbi:MAG TPA: NUDIX hydrolase [Candidatus Eisenbacteria bacterium]